MVKSRVALYAFLLACPISAIATFGFVFEQGSRIPSIRRTIGDGLSHIGAPGFVVAATFTGGHQTTLAATAIVGTIFNIFLYFFLWLAILMVATKWGKDKSKQLTAREMETRRNECGSVPDKCANRN